MQTREGIAGLGTDLQQIRITRAQEPPAAGVARKSIAGRGVGVGAGTDVPPLM